MDSRSPDAAKRQESLFQSRDGRLTVIGREVGIQVSVGKAHDFRSTELGPEEIAHLAHALNRWIGGFTSRA